LDEARDCYYHFMVESLLTCHAPPSKGEEFLDMAVWRDTHKQHDSCRLSGTRIFRNGSSHSWLFLDVPSSAAGRAYTCNACWGRERARVSNRWPNACATARHSNCTFRVDGALAHASLEKLLSKTADASVGGKDGVLIVDYTAPPKHGKHLVGVKRLH
jgi:hypothetical protein